MHNLLHRFKITTAIVLLAFFVLAFLPEAYAASDTPSYDAYIGDFADLLTDEEENELYQIMLEGTSYGNMVFMTIDDAEGYQSKEYIEMIYQTSDSFSGTDAVIFMIDMDNRLLWITGYGSNEKRITPDYANLITDNIYRKAKAGQYADCAFEGYRQINRRLAGERVSGSLRGLGNFCIAVIIAEILCFAFAYVTSAAKKAADYEILENIERTVNITNPEVKKAGRRRIYDPPSRSGGSGGRSGGGGGGGGGGGHGF